MNKYFHIAFWSKDHPKEAGTIPNNYLSALKITIEMDAIPPDNDLYAIDLCDHPLYKHLEQYVLANKRK